MTTRLQRSLAAALLLFASTAPAGTLAPYVDPRQQTDVAFGTFSFWHQPWRAYVDTWPIARLLDGAGVVFNAAPDEADRAASALSTHGFRHVRIEIGWGAFRWDDPSRLVDERSIPTLLRAAHAHDLRPLLLLNGNEGAPCPMRFIDTRVVAAAPAGARTVRLAPGIRDVEPGRTGFDGLTGYRAVEVPITAYDGKTGVAMLAKPLPVALARGPRRLGVVKYAPFGALRRPDGSVDPGTEATLRGWLDYVRAVGRVAESGLGTADAADAGFDLEVWNELTFGAAFLDARLYADPKPDGADDAQRGWWPLEEITARTAALVKDPGSRMPGVRVGNGFDSQRPWGAGSIEPPGVDAICKHPYPPRKRYPEDVPDGQALDATGRLDGARGKPSWVPRMTAFFPEYPLTALQTEHLIRDLSPIATDVYRTRHGRETHPPGGPPLAMWVTEMNVSPNEAVPDVRADRAMRVKAKAALRMFTAFNHKGVERVYLYAAKDRDVSLGLLGESFFAPGAARPSVSPVLAAVGRMMTWVRGRGGKIGTPRRLSVERVEEPEEHAVFAGDGTPAHPTLHHRDVLAVLPYQASATTFVVPYYVMTRDVMADLPEETFRVTFGGIEGGRVRVEAYDPIAGKAVPAGVVSTDDGTTLELRATDAPRLIAITEEGCAPKP